MVFARFFYLQHFVDVECIEQHFFFILELLAGQLMQVDVDKTVVIFVEFGWDHKLWHVDHEDVAIAVSELLCSLQALGS